MAIVVGTTTAVIGAGIAGAIGVVIAGAGAGGVVIEGEIAGRGGRTRMGAACR